MINGLDIAALIILLACTAAFVALLQRQKHYNTTAHFNCWSELGYFALFTFAGEAFAQFFLSRAWMAVAVGLAMVALSITGSCNRLNESLKNADRDNMSVKEIRKQHTFLCTVLGIAFATAMVWQLLKFALH